MDSKKHSKLIGDKAVISRKVGGEWSAFSGGLSGLNIALVPDKTIEQLWRTDDWPEGHYSTAKFILKSTKGGTKLMFSQKNIPESDFENIKQGWYDFYWDPMKATLEKK